MVSIIVPTYNAARFIGEALESLHRQTYRDFEVIVVDDGSTDDTRERVAALSAPAAGGRSPRGDPEVRYVYQPNAGEAAARNTGVRESTGEYIAFLDADDLWLPDKLARQMAVFAGRPDVDAVYTWWGWMDETGRPLPEVQTATHEGNVVEELFRGCFIMPTMVVLRRRCFDRVGLFDTRLRLSVDWDMWLRLAAAGCRFACVPCVLATKRRHAGQISANTAQVAVDSPAVLERAFSTLPARLKRESLRETALRNLFVTVACRLIRQGQLQEGVKWFAEGVRLQPYVLGRPAFHWGVARGLLPDGLATRQALVAHRDAVTTTLAEALRALFATPGLPDAVTRRQRAAWSAFSLVLSALRALDGERPKALVTFGQAVWTHPATPAGVLCRAIGKAASRVLTAAAKRS